MLQTAICPLVCARIAVHFDKAIGVAGGGPTIGSCVTEDRAKIDFPFLLGMRFPPSKVGYKVAALRGLRRALWAETA